ncbi:M1 family metallopeptidase [Crossiella cryophila]|uniref:Aminopeptidase N n=1 Tax=Crossiella cryophila TaxID=43355 RepID=A0A7W7C9E5_9PSEU|nr:M1 family metallopeptidase [Crossiella cryophila]MBB4675589.1 aminopeptidase N [Crossiella cryophila]
MRKVSLVLGALVSTLALGAGTALAAAEPGKDGVGDPYYPTDGNGGYDVSAYDVKLSYDPATRGLDAIAKITAKTTQELSRFNLDLRGLKVSSVKVNGQPAKFTRAGEHELVITPAGPLAKDAEIVVEVAYCGQPQPIRHPVTGLGGWRGTPSGGVIAAGAPHSASTWFPVNDTPMDKATFTVTTTTPQGWHSVSNGTRNKPSTSNGKTTTTWTATDPVAPHLIMLGIDKWTFQESTVDSTSVLSAFAPGSNGKALADKLPEVLKFLNGKLGDYHFGTVGSVHLADNLPYQVGSQTRPVLGRNADLNALIRTLAAQWWGGSMSVENWADTCTHECFANYLSWMWAEAKENKDLDAHYRKLVESVRNNADFWSRKLADPGRGKEFSAIYDKGALFVHALRRKIGERAFNTVLSNFPTINQGWNQGWHDLELYLEAEAQMDLKEFLDAWSHGTAIPADKHLFPA